jgi:alpha-1,6-mannosyltransferase
MSTSTQSLSDTDSTPTTTLQHCRRLGLAGSVVLVLGGMLAGVPPKHDPVLQLPFLQTVRTFTTLTVAVVFVGVCLLMLAWWRLGRLVRAGAPGTGIRDLLITLGWWSGPLLITFPIFSRDVYSYLAQGTMTGIGIDPYQYGPAALGGPLTVDIPQIWQTTPAPYGPVFLNVMGSVTNVTGLSIPLGILGMRLLSLVGLAMIIAAVPRIARATGVDPRAALWLGVLNPLTLIHLVGDAHNDALMLGLMLAGLAFALKRKPAVATVLIMLAALVKAPALLALVFIVPLWAADLTGRARWLRAGFAAGGVGIATAVVTTTVAGTGYGWLGALDTPTLAHTWTSLTTDVGYWCGLLADHFGLAEPDQVLAGWRLAGLAAAGVICLLMLRKHWHTPVVGLGLGLAAVLALGPVLHPWYVLWALIPLAAAATSAKIRRWVVISSIAMTAMVLPGGVQPTLDVFAGALLGAGLVFGGAWAARTLDRDDLVGSARAAWAESPWRSLRLITALRQMLQREPVAVDAEPADDAGGDGGHNGVVTKRFTRVDVRDVHLDERRAQQGARVPDGV